MRLWLAIRLFFAVLGSAALAHRLQSLLEGEPQVGDKQLADKQAEGRPSGSPPSAATPQKTAPQKTASSRSEAVSLLSTLQREARFVDIVKEPLDHYSDEQIGAAARDVLRDCGAVLERLFALEPVTTVAEGNDLEIPAGFDPGRFRLTGTLSGEPPFQGKVVHHGWQATRCELPKYSGSKAAALVVAPAEVEVRGG